MVEVNHRSICTFYDLDPFRVNRFRWCGFNIEEFMGIKGLSTLECGFYGGINFEPKKRHLDKIEKFIEKEGSKLNDNRI